MAIIAGLNKAPVSRLKNTIKEVPLKLIKKLKDFEDLMTAEGSYKNYRQLLASSTPPSIPYIGVYLIDLTYMEDGNPDMIDGRINFVKRDMVSKVIQKFQEHQQMSNAGDSFSEELMQLLWSIPAASNEYERLLWEQSKSKE